MEETELRSLLNSYFFVLLSNCSTHVLFYKMIWAQIAKSFSSLVLYRESGWELKDPSLIPSGGIWNFLFFFSS